MQLEFRSSRNVVAIIEETFSLRGVRLFCNLDPSVYLKVLGKKFLSDVSFALLFFGAFGILNHIDIFGSFVFVVVFTMVNFDTLSTRINCHMIL